MNPTIGTNGQERRMESRYRALITLIAILASATGTLVVTGWVLGIQALVQLRRDFNVMKFNTALCLIAFGIGLLMLLYARGAWRIIASSVIGIGILATGALSLLETLLGWNLHIDQLFWNDLQWHVDEPRMVPQTAVFFIFAGLFLLVSSGLPTESIKQLRRRFPPGSVGSLQPVAWESAFFPTTALMPNP